MGNKKRMSLCLKFLRGYATTLTFTFFKEDIIIIKQE